METIRANLKTVDEHNKKTREEREEREGKVRRTEELLGCSIADFVRYLESKFLPGMMWDNYGQPGWEIDHILPVSSFDLTDPEQQRKCFHFSNHQPLWGPDNNRKRNKVL